MRFETVEQDYVEELPCEGELLEDKGISSSREFGVFLSIIQKRNKSDSSADFSFPDSLRKLLPNPPDQFSLPCHHQRCRTSMMAFPFLAMKAPLLPKSTQTTSQTTTPNPLPRTSTPTTNIPGPGHKAHRLKQAIATLGTHLLLTLILQALCRLDTPCGASRIRCGISCMTGLGRGRDCRRW
jgi:hypothetical protein